ncbi:VapE domain-containing protein [Pseudomonas fluorescens]
MSALAHYRDLTEGEVAAALTYVPADCTREEWVKFGMAIKAEFGAAGWDLFNDWSKAGGNKYDAKAARDTWKSIKTSGGITIATLIHEAQQFGYSLNADKREPINQSEIEARAARRNADEQAAEATQRQRYAQAAARATAMWNAAAPVEGSDHPYLERKGVMAFGLSLGQWTNDEEVLLVPARNIDGHLTTLQAIFSNANPQLGRDRDFLKGGQQRGCFHLIGGKPNGTNPIIAVCEGYATGATIHQATGWFVAVAFTAGNLASVARDMRKLFPLATIVIAADNDQWTDGNPGIHHARQAASSASAVLAVPEFHTLESRPTDFNDLHAMQGLDAVRTQLVATLPDEAGDNHLGLESSVSPFGFPNLSDRQQPLNTWQNMSWMLDQYGVTVRYNIIAKEVEVGIPGKEFPAEDAANCAKALISSLCGLNRMPKTELAPFIKLLGHEKRYNPVADFILSKPWDGVSRLGDVCDTLQTAEGYSRDLLALMLRRWLISAVAAALLPSGFKSKGVLVLQGPQSIGKTAWVKALVPEQQRSLIKEGALIDPANKDSVSSAIGHWIVELGELDGTLRKTDIARLKGFISNDTDMLRKPYDQSETKYQRRTVFFASVNPSDFLTDDTGNVRWWTVPVVTVNYNHAIDMQQLWAEVAVLFRDGEQWWLDRSEEAALEVVNNQHQTVDPVEEMIRSHFRWDAPDATFKLMKAAQVLIAIGFDKPTPAQSRSAAKALRKITGREPRDTTVCGDSGKYFLVGPTDARPF